MDMTAINVIWGPLLLRPGGEMRMQDLPPDPMQAQMVVQQAGERGAALPGPRPWQCAHISVSGAHRTAGAWRGCTQ